MLEEASELQMMIRFCNSFLLGCPPAFLGPLLVIMCNGGIKMAQLNNK